MRGLHTQGGLRSPESGEGGQVHLIRGRYGYDRNRSPSRINEVGWKVFDALGPENVCVSPISLYEALAIVANGADNSSETEMELIRLLGCKTVRDANEMLGACHGRIDADIRGKIRFTTDNLMVVNKARTGRAEVKESYRESVRRAISFVVWRRTWRTARIQQRRGSESA